MKEKIVDCFGVRFGDGELCVMCAVRVECEKAMQKRQEQETRKVKKIKKEV